MRQHTTRTYSLRLSRLVLFGVAIGMLAISATGCSDNDNENNNGGLQQAPPPPVITTYAGNGSDEETGENGDNGDALDAQLLPFDVATDAAGNLYIADVKDNTIRKVDALTGEITTVAGTAGTAGYTGDNGPAVEAELNSPFGVAVDSFGNIFIADTGNHTIRRVDAATQMMSTVAGTGSSGFTGDSGQATEADLFTPVAVTVDLDGNLFVSDMGNQRIRKIDSSGVITTVAGNGASGYSGDNVPATETSLYGPWGLTTDDANNLYVVDSSNHRLRKIDAQTGDITTLAGDGTYAFGGDGGDASLSQLHGALDVEMDANGNLLLSEYGSDRVRQIDLNTNIITTRVGNGIAGFSGDGGEPLEAQVTDPFGIAVDPFGNLFISDRGNYRVRKVTP